MPNLTVEERKRLRNHRMKAGRCLTREIQIRFKSSKVLTGEEPSLWNKGGAATITRHLVVVLSTEDFSNNNNHKTTVITTTTTTVNNKIGIDP